MMTTTAPPWLRRSDQAVTWARNMLRPHTAVIIDTETTDLPGAIGGKVGYSNLRNRSEQGPRHSRDALRTEDPSSPRGYVDRQRNTV